MSTVQHTPPQNKNGYKLRSAMANVNIPQSGGPTQAGSSATTGYNEIATKIQKTTTTTPAEMFAIIRKMFLDPIPTLCPTGVDYMPSGIEILRNRLENDHCKYSPVMWADPLLVNKLTVNSDEEHIEWNPAIGVDVNNSRTMRSSPLVYSAFGAQVKAIVDTDISQSGAIRAMLPVPGIKCQRSLAAIMHMATLETSPNIDEAALLRLLLLQTATMDPTQLVYASSAVNEICVNTFVEDTKTKSVWITTSVDQIPGQTRWT